MSTFPPPLRNPDDRYGWLMFFGIVQILLGALAFGMVFVTLLAHAAVRRLGGAHPSSMRLMGNSLFHWAVLGVGLMILGIGSTRCRRWAQALTLVVNWIVMVEGVVITLITAVVLPRIMLAFSAHAAHPHSRGAMLVLSALVIGFFTVFFVLIPLIFVIVYSRNSVRATCEQRDSVPRWTDQVPLLLLALMVMYFWGAIYLVGMAVFLPVFPLFGIYVSGWAAAAVCIAWSAVLVRLTVGMYRKDIRAWWMALALKVMGLLSCLTTIAHSGVAQLFRMMHMRERGVEFVLQHEDRLKRLISAGIIGAVVAGIIFLMIVRQSFAAPEPMPAEPRA